MPYKRYKYTTYIIKLIADRAKVELNKFSLHLIYIYTLCGAFLVLIYIILDRYSQDYIRLVYAINTQYYIYLLLLPITATIVRVLFIISIYFIYIFSITDLVLLN